MAKGGSTIRISDKSHKNASLFDFEPLVNSKDRVYLMPCCLCNVRVNYTLIINNKNKNNKYVKEIGNGSKFSNFIL